MTTSTEIELQQRGLSPSDAKNLALLHEEKRLAEAAENWHLVTATQKKISSYRLEGSTEPKGFRLTADQVKRFNSGALNIGKKAP